MINMLDDRVISWAVTMQLGSCDGRPSQGGDNGSRKRTDNKTPREHVHRKIMLVLKEDIVVALQLLDQEDHQPQTYCRVPTLVMKPLARHGAHIKIVSGGDSI